MSENKVEKNHIFHYSSTLRNNKSCVQRLPWYSNICRENASVGVLRALPAPSLNGARNNDKGDASAHRLRRLESELLEAKIAC